MDDIQAQIKELEKSLAGQSTLAAAATKTKIKKLRSQLPPEAQAQKDGLAETMPKTKPTPEPSTIDARTSGYVKGRATGAGVTAQNARRVAQATERTKAALDVQDNMTNTDLGGTANVKPILSNNLKSTAEKIMELKKLPQSPAVVAAITRLSEQMKSEAKKR